MNDFASALSTALHEEAKEIGMSSDLQEAQRQLEQSMRSSDQRRSRTLTPVQTAR